MKRDGDSLVDGRGARHVLPPALRDHVREGLLVFSGAAYQKRAAFRATLNTYLKDWFGPGVTLREMGKLKLAYRRQCQSHVHEGRS